MQRFVVGINGDWSPAKLHPLAQGQITFLLELSDGKIVALDYELGFNHRGDEKVLEARDFRQGLSLINRPGWQVPISFELAYARACEELMGLKVPLRAQAIRHLLLQMQIWMGRLRFQIALAQSTDRSTDSAIGLLETAMGLHERIAGARLHDSFLRLGGVAEDVDARDIADVEKFWGTVSPIHFDFPSFSELNQTKLSKLNCSNDGVLQAVHALTAAAGEVAVQLPKVVKVPRGQSYQAVPSMIGDSAVWLHSDGGKAPARISLIPASLRLLLEIQELAVGLSLPEFQELLLCTPLSIGELDR